MSEKTEDGAYARNDELDDLEESFLFEEGLNLEEFNQLEQFNQLELMRRERLDTVEEITEPARLTLNNTLSFCGGLTGGGGCSASHTWRRFGGSTLGVFCRFQFLMFLLKSTNSDSVNLNLKNYGLNGTVDLIFM